MNEQEHTEHREFRAVVAGALRIMAWAVEHTDSEERFWQVNRRATGSINSAVDRRYPSRRSPERQEREAVLGD